MFLKIVYCNQIFFRFIGGLGLWTVDYFFISQNEV